MEISAHQAAKFFPIAKGCRNSEYGNCIIKVVRNGCDGTPVFCDRQTHGSGCGVIVDAGPKAEGFWELSLLDPFNFLIL
jgi:hypothetical protein